MKWKAGVGSGGGKSVVLGVFAKQPERPMRRGIHLPTLSLLSALCSLLDTLTQHNHLFPLTWPN